MQRAFPASFVSTHSPHMQIDSHFRNQNDFLAKDSRRISCSISCRFPWVIPSFIYWFGFSRFVAMFHMRLELIACSLRNRFNLSPRVDFMPHIRIHINEAASLSRLRIGWGSAEDRTWWSLLLHCFLTDSRGLPVGVDLYASIPHFYFFGCHLAKIFHISRHRAHNQPADRLLLLLHRLLLPSCGLRPARIIASFDLDSSTETWTATAP